MEIVINGNVIAVPDDLQNVTLLDFLRDFVMLTGTKFGCGVGLCGACTVHLDGVAARSCQTYVSDIINVEVTTIEGLDQTSPGEGLHPVQQAWIAEGVPQCGYCQAGQIMTASALLHRNPAPTDAEIREEMNGNLCRCGTYDRIRRAITRVAQEA
ncbi:(2Fe-2S)-binding protein [Parasedimentitalea huanghaiensis]|uniref:2Fe-2S iron-sulfur cluster binding domain-containing protein n=1 Tax=Parasedimentitalea huanghaiensis TaxID=2682100 RepID=A0A6L6WKN1_9RHOB|nr:(2Fe-2S)-binding protein [Zongyanglinia huanghaiensis]MVO17961.1 2Fe-2S iron-sulfur cluster binding domain-containing protein [Zongyanglinia huanghaiensis]